MKGNLLTADIWDQKGDRRLPDQHVHLPDRLQGPEQPSTARSRPSRLVDFLWWATHDGQKYAEELDYAPLAKPVLEKVEAAMKELTYKGEKLKVGGGMGGM